MKKYGMYKGCERDRHELVAEVDDWAEDAQYNDQPSAVILATLRPVLRDAGIRRGDLSNAETAYSSETRAQRAAEKLREQIENASCSQVSKYARARYRALKR